MARETKPKRKVIARRNLPAGLPLWQTVALVLVLDRLAAHGWVWGVALTLAALWWVVALASMRTEHVDLFGEGGAKGPAAERPLFDFNGSITDTAGGVTTARAVGR